MVFWKRRNTSEATRLVIHSHGDGFVGLSMDGDSGHLDWMATVQLGVMIILAGRDAAMDIGVDEDVWNSVLRQLEQERE